MSPTRAAQWLKLYLAGWDANVPMFKSKEKPVTFSLGDGPKMTLKEALAAIETANERSDRMTVALKRVLELAKGDKPRTSGESMAAWMAPRFSG